MRSQAERDEQTLEIMTAVFAGVVVFGLIAAMVWIGHVAGLDPNLDSALVPALVVVYFAAVAVHLRRRRHH